MKVIGWPQSALGASLARELGTTCSELFVRHFPDGETLVRIDADVAGEHVIMAVPLDHPDAKALPLFFAADAARELGAHRVTLVAPYLSYMRQDARFHPGEAISSRTFARLVTSSFDALVTVDPHLHRYATLSDVYSIPTRIVPSAPAIAQWICTHVASPLVVGPDSESEQWVAEVARLAGAPHTVMNKTRRGDRDVQVVLGNAGPWPGRTPVLVDDIVSTGHTLIAAAAALKEAGLAPAIAVGVHALFDDAAQVRMQAAGLAQVVTCDTVAHVTNAIRVLPAIAEALRKG